MADRIAELLVKTGAYRDLDKPVILTSGQLGIFYVNTEKLVQDNGAWEKLGDNANAMVDHAWGRVADCPEFADVIDIISEKASSYHPAAISGGQRRDWLFSGPVAANLDLPHVALYKDGGMEVRYPTGSGGESPFNGRGEILHIVDLLTEGSSCNAGMGSAATGWVPMIRRGNGKISNLLAVVTRRQGGEENLRNVGVNVESFVSIDEAFLTSHSSQPDTAVAYLQNPNDWSASYLRTNGALAFVDSFNPAGGKLDRAGKFYARFSNLLREAGKLEELDCAVRDKYGVGIVGCLGDKK